MSSRISISIIVPIYNVEDYLPACLDSIERQFFDDCEVLLVNDGSTDSSVTIAQTYIDRHENWSLIHKENGGLSSARNAGIARAQGEYICFVDSDDLIAPDYLQKLYEAAVTLEADMVIADYHEVDESGRDLCRDKGRAMYEQGLIARDKALQALTYVGGYHFATAVVVAWNKLIRADIMKQFSYPEGMLHEDEFIIMPLLLACDRIAWIENDLYCYRQREGSIMQDEKLAFKHLRVLDAFEERIRIAKGLDDALLLKKLKMAYFWDIEVWYYFMRTGYQIPWYKLYIFFARRMWGALIRYGHVWGKKRFVKYTIFAIAPEVYLKYIYK